MTTTLSTALEKTIQQYFTSIGTKTAATLLHIHPDYTILAYGTGKPELYWLLEIGFETTANLFFKHNPPTPGEVENAIQTVEDEVMALRKLLPNESTLFTIDQPIRNIAKQQISTTNTEGLVLSRSSMEQIFGRLAAIISGRPASSDTLPTDNNFAATLLILREVMHHLKFTEIHCF